jgi:thioredoxin 1
LHHESFTTAGRGCVQPLVKGIVLVLLGVAVMLAAATGRQRSEPDLLGLAAKAGAHTDPVPAGYGPSVPGIPRLVAIGAGECIPCKAMAPVRADLRREYEGVLGVDFYDVWKNPAAGRHFRTRVIPTLIFYAADGRELGRREGYVSKAEIIADLGRWGVSLRPTGG